MHVPTGDARERGELVCGLHGLRLGQGGQQGGLSCGAIEEEMQESAEQWGESQRQAIANSKRTQCARQSRESRE